jgi:predicted RNA-binding protein
MEAATDRFAQEFVLCLAKTIAYCPSGESLLETMVYRDCTGQLTNEDVLSLRALERRVSASDLLPEEAAYLKQMRLFVQYVTMRYQAFLATYNAQQREELHAQILQGMISGKLSTLCAFLDTLQGGPRSFVALFKTPDY